MERIYFIDSENVGDSWVKLLDEPDSRLIVFYTANSPRIDYSRAIELMNAENSPEFIKCYGGNNGLDFQLISYLGYEICNDDSKEMIVVSKDAGFDAAVRFWNDRGKKVSRLRLITDTKSQPKLDDAYVFYEGEECEPSGPKEEEVLSKVDMNELYTIINCVGGAKCFYIHNILVRFYGEREGLIIYNYLKKDGFSAPKVQWKVATRMYKLIMLIVKYENKACVDIPESVPAYIINNVVDDNNAMIKKLRSVFGDRAQEIHDVFKPHYRVLVQIKNQ